LVNRYKKNKVEFYIILENQQYKIQLVQNENQFGIKINDGKEIFLKIDYKLGSYIFKLVNGNDEKVLQVLKNDVYDLTLQYKGTRFELKVFTKIQNDLIKHIPIKPPSDLTKFCMSPMPGAIISINVVVGQKVTVNQELVVMEAMKMQNLLRCKIEGVVKKINCKPGQIVANNVKLIEFE